MAENEKILETEETPAPVAEETAPVEEAVPVEEATPVEEPAKEEVKEVKPAPAKEEVKKPAKTIPNGKVSFGAKVKEWCRKQTVSLKRAPQRIPLVILAITTIYFMLVLFPLSNALNACNAAVDASGICQFICTLLSLLVLVSFLNAFPKRKKPNIFFIVLVFVMIAGMIACDLVIYFETQNYLAGSTVTEADLAAISPIHPLLIGHVVLLGVSAVIFALLPVYAKLINKINTKVVLESATENMQGEIDIQED